MINYLYYYSPQLIRTRILAIFWPSSYCQYFTEPLFFMVRFNTKVVVEVVL